MNSTDMRNLMALMESASIPPNGERLEGGILNPMILIDYLPGVDSPSDFELAWRKIINNQERKLTRKEIVQLAKAFISLIRQEDAAKLAFMRKLLLVSTEEDPGALDPITWR